MSPRPIALVTGPTSGIGRSIAESLAGAGYDLILVSRSEDALRKLAEELQSKHRQTEPSGSSKNNSTAELQISTYVADLSVSGTGAAIIDRLDRLDVLVNCAGKGDFGNIEVQTEEDVQKLVQLNCTSMVAMSQKAFPLLKKSRGKVVNIGSLAAWIPVPYFAVYAASKAFVSSLSVAMNEEWKPHGVSVICINPGGVDTQFFKSAGLPISVVDENRRWLISSDVIGRGVIRLLKKPRAVWIPGPGGSFVGPFLRALSPSFAAARGAAFYKRYHDQLHSLTNP